MMKRLPVLSLLFVLSFYFGCSRVSLVTSYYLLDYRPVVHPAKYGLEETLPFSAQVLNFKIPRSFDSIRIIARFSSHQINYYRYSLWAVRPQIAVADLLVQHINAYQIFIKCQREFLDERPDYEITGEIYQIERFESMDFSAAHLKMSYELYNYNTGELLVTHSFDREEQIPPGKMSIFAKAISDIIAEETNIFLQSMVDHFQPDSLQAESRR